MSLRFVPLPSFLNTFPNVLFSSLLSFRALSVHLLVSLETSMWERATSALGLTPFCWVSTTLEFSPVHYLSTTLRFSSVCYVLTALRFSLIRCALIALELTLVHCEVGAHCPLVASFLFILADVKPCGEYSGLRWVSLFVYEDHHSSHLVGWLLYGSSCRGIWKYRFCISCIKFSSIHSTAARIISTFCSM